MNKSEKNPADFPVIAVTSGEPAGIGPDICLALTAQGRALGCRPVILGDWELLSERARLQYKPVALYDYQPGSEPPEDSDVLEVLHLPLLSPSEPGKLDAANSPYVLALLDRAIAGCLQGEFAAMVTAPLHKGIINKALAAGGGEKRKENFTGHTEYLAEKTGVDEVVMMLAGQSYDAHLDGMLRVALVTTHLSLRDVPDAITPDKLEKVICVLHSELQQKCGFAEPRLLVSALNPHAGEGGYLGREEIEIIQPTLEKLRGKGMHITGPLPADTLFTPSILASGDVALAMYHDQGLAPLKYATFLNGVNITLGLPFIRTSVDHGTALSLAGSGKARAGSLLAALQEATKMAWFAQERRS